MIGRDPPKRERSIPRRGSTYIMVLGTALIASVLGLSALMVQRIQRKAHQSASDVVAARLCADAALRVGMLRIENDPDWRYSFSNGAWEADVPVGEGTYTLEGTDPTDSNLSNAPEDPLVLTGTGKKGASIQKVQITLAPTNRAFSCLDVAAQAGVDVIFADATLNCDQTVSANSNVDAVNSDVFSDVEAVSAVTGSSYHNATQTGMAARTLPDTVDVFNYYLLNGTWIDKNSLPLGFNNLLPNPGMETGLAPWASFDDFYPGRPACDLAVDATEFHSGAASVKATNRANFQAGPTHDIAGVVQSGVTYDCTAWVKMTTSDANVHLTIDTDSSGEGVQYWLGSDTLVRVVDGWTQISNALTPTFTGTLNSATLKVETRDVDPVNDFYVDDVVFKEQGADRTIHQKLLSPNSNPFGAETNPQGIYLIDMAGQMLFINSSRIVGTLVVISPDDQSRIGYAGPLNWEPAVPGFPALMVKNGNVTINSTTSGLVESTNVTNFNPPGTPYSGLGEDSDQNDTYPSEINGLIYSTGSIRFRRSPVINGAAVAHDKVEFYGDVDLTYNAIHRMSPPPGFNGPEEIRILLNSAQKALD